MGVVPQPEPGAHIGPCPWHDLHQPHRPGEAGDRSAVQHRAPAALSAHDALDPLGWNTEAGRCLGDVEAPAIDRSEEHTSELQSLMRNSYAVFCLKTKKIY